MEKPSGAIALEQHDNGNGSSVHECTARASMGKAVGCICIRIQTKRPGNTVQCA
jgi:hypothetical protein